MIVWAIWACGLCGRGGRLGCVAEVVVWLSCCKAVQWFVEGERGFTLEVKHPVTESLGWKKDFSLKKDFAKRFFITRWSFY